MRRVVGIGDAGLATKVGDAGRNRASSEKRVFAAALLSDHRRVFACMSSGRLWICMTCWTRPPVTQDCEDLQEALSTTRGLAPGGLGTRPTI